MTDFPAFFRFESTDSVLRIQCHASVAPHQIDLLDCRTRISEILATLDCEEVVFDLSDVKILSSRLLGLMAALQKAGVPVWVESATPQILELLKLTRYDAVIKVRQPVS